MTQELDELARTDGWMTSASGPVACCSNILINPVMKNY